MPVFSPNEDTYDSVRSRSSLLFDTIITFGARVAYGPLSQTFQRLHSISRERICDLIIADPTSIRGGLEAVQALLVLSCYSDKGWLLASVATRIALELDLPASVDKLFAIVMRRRASAISTINDDERRLLRLARVWFGLFNTEQM